MALVVKDRVRETTATTGTGTLTLGGAVSGFQDFSVIGNGNTTYYAIVDAATGSWEVGLGTYTSSGTTLSRDTVLESSNNGNLVPFLSGTKDVFCTYPAERSVYADGTSIASPAANLTANRVMYATSTSAMGQSANLTFDGTTLTANTLTVSTGATTVPAGTVSAPAITTSGDTNTGIFFPAADTIAFTEGGVESMRIDSSGRLLIGTTASRTNVVTSGSRLQIEDTSSSASPAFVRNTADTIASYVVLGKSRGTTVGSFTAVTSGDQVGGVSFEGADGTALVEAARVQGFVDGTVSTGVVPGRLAFYTASSAGSLTERMRIDSSGNLGLGVTPSAWGTTQYKAAQIGNGGFIAGRVASGDQDKVVVGANAYNDGTNWRYIATDNASYYLQTGSGHYWYNAPSGTAGNTITFTQAMTLDASGNLGLGVVPSAWGTSYKAFQILGPSGTVAGALWQTQSNVLQIGNNVYSASGGDTYYSTAAAVKYAQTTSEHRWYNAPSGTAGNAITFTQAMTLDASGRLGIGTTSPNALLHLSANPPVLALGSTGTSDPRIDFYDQATTTIAGSIFLDQSEDNLCILRTASGSATNGIRIDSSGNVGIGTTSPSSYTSGDNLVVANATGNGQMTLAGADAGNPTIQFRRVSAPSTTRGYIQYDNTSDWLRFATNGSERMRIASDGVITSTLGGMQVISGTSVTASTTAVQFTGLPSWVKRITVMFNGVSTSGTASIIIQLGTGSTPTYVISGYLGSSANIGASSATLVTAGLATTSALTSASVINGIASINLVSSASNIWASTAAVGFSNAAGMHTGGSSVSLASALTAVRVTTTGTDTFDAGNINILYE